MSELTNALQDGDGLVARYLENPRADLKDLIMVQYSSMVERIARRFSGLESYEDLVQVGYIGLLNALSKFDPSAGVRFNTYATHLVAGEIKHYLRDRTQTIRQPAWLQELRHKVNKTLNLLQAELGRQPSAEEIAVRLDISASAVQEVFQTQEMLRVASLDTATTTDDDSSEIDQLDAGDFCPEQLSVEDRVVLERALGQLRDLERDVLVLFHFESLNQSEIANRLDISCNYVSHILRQSLGKLRRLLVSEEASDRRLKKAASAEDQEVLCPLTGVYNEDYFKSRLKEELHRATASDAPVSVIRLDFKGTAELKQYFGEVCLNDLIIDATQFVKEQLRSRDILCRFGKTGLAIILPGTGPSSEVLFSKWMSRFDQWLSNRRAPSGPIVSLPVLVQVPANAQTFEEVLSAISAEAKPTPRVKLTVVEGAGKPEEEDIRRAA